jgi:hypothetical protein
MNLQICDSSSCVMSSTFRPKTYGFSTMEIVRPPRLTIHVPRRFGLGRNVNDAGLFFFMVSVSPDRGDKIARPAERVNVTSIPFFEVTNVPVSICNTN